MQHKDRRQDILRAAMELFAKKGFRGTTTRDLAAQADVNEAIIFRYFKTKEDLYRAILEEKMQHGRAEKDEELRRLADSGSVQFLEGVGRRMLEKHEQDTTFIRLLLFSALEGHELADMFLDSMPERDPLAAYMQKRIDDGVFKPMDANLAARAFVGMFFMFIQTQAIFGLNKKQSFDRDQVIRTFVSIFLTGITR
jgi:TetR/AcrR family transcriptional regulator